MKILLRVVPVFFLAVLLARTAINKESSTTVEVQILDAASGKVTPAMVCITDLADGSVRLPPDGRLADRASTVNEFFKGIGFDPDRNWIGPVRKTAGVGPLTDKERSYVYEGRPALPYWNERMMYQTSGNFSIMLPPGKWRISVSRGMEFVPVAEEFSTGGRGAGKAALVKKIKLSRWIDLAKQGWYSGDVHVHHPTVEEAQRRFMVEYARAEDLHMVNILTQTGSATGKFHSPQAGFGPKFRVEKDGYWLVSGQEVPSSLFGHTIGLNVSSLVHDTNPDTYDLYDLAFKKVHQQPGALVGFAHFSWRGCEMPAGFPWVVTSGEVDFVELLQFAQLNPMDYYDYLNLGFKLTAAAGSDAPWGSTMGEVRTYVYTGSTFDPDRWFAAMKKGNTFVTSGPALEFTVDGELPGSELARQVGSVVKVVARVQSHAKVGGLPCTLSITGNDGNIKEISSGPQQADLSITADVPIRESRWFAASASCKNGGLAHSSPVYVIVNGRPAWSVENTPGAANRALKLIRITEQGFTGKTDKRSMAILERIDKAKKFYADVKERIAPEKK